MTSICNFLTSRVRDLLSAEPNVDARVQALAEASGFEIHGHKVSTIVAQNTPIDLAEKSLQAKYPAIQVYCDKLSNVLKEKFRTFSGKAHLIIEIRCSQDRLEGIDGKLNVYAEAVCDILDGARGDWGNGAFYAGGYDALFGPVRHGGHNFLDIVKIGFEVDISK